MNRRRLPLRVAAALLASGLVCGGGAQASAQAPPTEPGSLLWIVAMPRAAAEEVFRARPGTALGLGVFPESRDPLAFIREIGVGAPRGRGSASELSGARGRLGRALEARAIRVLVARDGPQPLTNALAFALGTSAAAPPVADLDAVLHARLGAVAMRSAKEFDDLDRRLRNSGGVHDAFVLGVSAQTPVLVGRLSGTGRNTANGPGGYVLTEGLARRPAIVTPYDLAVTILAHLGVRPGKDGGFVGSVLAFGPPSDPSERSTVPEVLAIEQRLLKDATSGPALAQITTALALGSLALALALWALGLRGPAVRAAQGSWFALGGYEAARFVPEARVAIRAIPIIVALAIGAALPARRPRHIYERVAFGAALAFGVLFAIAPLRPGGEPGLSLWGNPLTSWRFFGLQNGQAAFLAAGIVVWGAMAGLGSQTLASVSIAGALVIGAPRIGANFVGVFTFVFGASLAVCALARRRVELWHVVVSGAVAAGAFVLALLADAGSPVSHGGRAARRISEGGLSAAWGFVRARLDLNVHLIRSIWGGFVWVAILLGGGAALAVWGARVDRGPAAARAAVWAGAMMGLASLVLEDSGFYSGGNLLLAVPAAWMIAAGLSSRSSDPRRLDGG